MKFIGLLFIYTVYVHNTVFAEEFLVRVANERMAKNLPISASDFNIVFDIEVCCESKEGIFANVISKGGCFFKDAIFGYSDGSKRKKLGGRSVLPASNIEKNLFLFVPGAQQEDFKYRQVATICTDLEEEVVEFKALPNVPDVQSFRGSIFMDLKIFSVKNNKFIQYDLEVTFESKRLPTGVMEFSM